MLINANNLINEQRRIKKKKMIIEQRNEFGVGEKKFNLKRKEKLNFNQPDNEFWNKTFYI